MSNPADHSFYFDPNDDPCPYCDAQMAGELSCQNCLREHPDRCGGDLRSHKGKAEAPRD